LLAIVVLALVNAKRHHWGLMLIDELIAVGLSAALVRLLLTRDT